MRFDLGMAILFTAATVAACSSSSNAPAGQNDAASDVCSASLASLTAVDSGPGAIACPTNASGTELNYDQAIESTCSTYKLKAGDVQYGPCFEYLVFEVDMDSSGHNFSKCFYDPTTHDFVGVIYGDGTMDQCGTSSYTVAAGDYDPSCSIAGFQGGGAMYESCSPIVDAGSESMLLGQ
jgi:hypothetical protein